MSGFGDSAALLFYRFAAGGGVSASRFRDTDPAEVTRAKRRGRLRLEIVSHCWRYAHLLGYQLSSLVHHPTGGLDVTMTVYHSPEDEETLRVLRFFGEMALPGIAWSWRPLPRERLFRRSIGRNLAAKTTRADWIWFTDADVVFHERCLATLAERLQGRDDALLYPERTLGTPLLPEDHPLLAQGREGPALLRIPRQAFPLRRASKRAMGPFQITHGDVARACGYCETIALYQKPARRWRKAYEDGAFRWLLGTPGRAIPVPDVCQIRHLAKGRYREGAFGSKLRPWVRSRQERRSSWSTVG